MGYMYAQFGVPYSHSNVVERTLKGGLDSSAFDALAAAATSRADSATLRIVNEGP